VQDTSQAAPNTTRVERNTAITGYGGAFHMPGSAEMLANGSSVSATEPDTGIAGWNARPETARTQR
jgi:hypothetical protein